MKKIIIAISLIVGQIGMSQVLMADELKETDKSPEDQTIETSAVLEVYSTSKGVLIPRITENTDGSIPITSPKNGLLIYNDTKDCIQENRGADGTHDWSCLVGENSASLKYFYSPSVSIPLDTGVETGNTVDLYQHYVDTYTKSESMISSPTSEINNPAATKLDVYGKTDLNYHVLNHTGQIENVTINENGVLTYDIVEETALFCGYLNVVFEVK